MAELAALDSASISFYRKHFIVIQRCYHPSLSTRRSSVISDIFRDIEYSHFHFPILLIFLPLHSKIIVFPGSLIQLNTKPHIRNPAGLTSFSERSCASARAVKQSSLRSQKVHGHALLSILNLYLIMDTNICRQKKELGFRIAAYCVHDGPKFDGCGHCGSD